MTIDLIYLGLSCLIAIGSIVTSILTTTGKSKKARALEVLANVVTYVEQAEQIFGAGNGQAKLQWVLTKVQIDCVKNNVKLTDEEIAKQVESILSTPNKKEQTSKEKDSTKTHVTNEGYGQISYKKESE